MAHVKDETEKVLPATPVVAQQSTQAELLKGPRSYLAMMLLATILTPTGLARAYRGERIGWTRFWIFIGLYAVTMLLFWIPILNILLALGLLALYVWGAIDVFQLYKTRTDAEGGALATTPRDEKFAHGFFVLFIVTLVLSGIGVLLALLFGTLFVGFLLNMRNSDRSFPSYDQSESRNFDQFDQLR